MELQTGAKMNLVITNVTHYFRNFQKKNNNIFNFEANSYPPEVATSSQTVSEKKFNLVL